MSTNPSPPAPQPTRIAKPKRGSETAWDMVRSLGLIAVIVAVTLVFVPGLLHPSKKDKVQPITYSNYLEGFRSLTGISALAPTPVPAGWHANSAALNGESAAEHLRIGFVTTDSKYVALHETLGDPIDAIDTILGKTVSKVTGDTDIAGVTWDVRTSSQHEPALIRTTTVTGRGVKGTNRLTVIVTGSATMAQLQALAASLK